jgi:CDGSH-type Zn-finger protein
MSSSAEFLILKNGPIKVSGSFNLKSTEGDIINTTNEIFLCRCGGSANKPFCDGTHNNNNFKG